MVKLSSKEFADTQKQILRDSAFLKEAKRLIELEFLQIQKDFLEEFEKHPVTREIEAGPSSTNISKTLAGVGNLFTYIGFSEGDTPIKPLRSVLEFYKIRYHVGRRFVTATFELPTKQQVFAATPMPWATGRSWARGVERGISGLGKYLVKDAKIAKSRSGIAIQTKSKVRNGKFTNISYLSLMLNEYYKNVKNLEKKTFS